MQTNKLVFFTALLSVLTLFAAEQSAITLKVRTPVPPGNGMISDVAFPIQVTLDSSMGDIGKKLVDEITKFANQEPTCESCANCMYIRIAKALKSRKQFAFYFGRFKPLNEKVTIAQLKLHGFTEGQSLGALQPDSGKSTKEEGKQALVPIEKTRTKSAA